MSKMNSSKGGTHVWVHFDKPADSCSSGILVVALLLLLLFFGLFFFLAHPHDDDAARTVSKGEETKGVDLLVPIPVDSAIFNVTAPICTSYFEHMCGGWNVTNQDLSFTSAGRRAYMLLNKLIKDPSSGAAFQLYKSCLDTLVFGLHEKEEEMQRDFVLQDIMGELDNESDLAVVLGRLNHYGFTAPFGMSIEKHPTHPTMMPLFQSDDFSFEVSIANVTELYQMSQMQPPTEARIHALVDMVRTMRSWLRPDQTTDYVDYIERKLAGDTLTMGELMDISGSAGDYFWVQFLRELDGHSLDTISHAKEPVWVIDKTYFGKLLTHDAFTLQQWRDYVELSILEGNQTPPKRASVSPTGS